MNFMNDVVNKAVQFVKHNVNDTQYHKTYEYGMKIFNKFYDPNKNGTKKESLVAGIVLYDVLNKGISLEEIHKLFNDDTIFIIQHISEYPNYHILKGYEGLFKGYDIIFEKLIIREAKIHFAIEDLNSTEFRKYIDGYNELRRKLHKEADPDMMNFMDYESDLIKYGRNVFSGKPAANYKYEKLVVDA